MTSNAQQHDILLDARQLWRDYDGEIAVRELDLELRRGDILGFLGPNGAGKSTTMQMLSGNLAPSAGSIAIAGIDLLENPVAAKRELGYLPEQPPLYPDLTVDEYLDFCARLHGLHGAQRRTAIDRAVERCGLGDRRRRLIANLSKGFQQRTGIAQAILHDPAVVILDEPTVGLDPIQIREIRDMIRELGESHAVILSTHILPEVQETCSRVLLIHRGRPVHAASLADMDSTQRQVDITAERLPDVETLRRLPGVIDATRTDDRLASLMLGEQADTAALLAAAAAAGWGLSAFTPQRRSLEQLFVELTARDAEDPA